jgi:hypothetical protein
LKVLLQQRGLHEVFSGGIGSFRMYLMLIHFLEAEPNGGLQSFLSYYGGATFNYLDGICIEGVEADLSSVRIADCKEAFQAAAAALEPGGLGLSAVLDGTPLARSRERGRRKAHLFMSTFNVAPESLDGGAGVVAQGTKRSFGDISRR